jgi:Zn-dependent protease
MFETADRRGSFRVGNLFGIPFFIDASWFFILALVTWSYGSQLAAEYPNWSPLSPWILGFMAGLGLFSSVLIHELGHSFVAMAQGISVRSISLFLFGGVARIERESTTPWGALAIAVAGPLVSLTLFGFFWGVEQWLPLNEGVRALVGLLTSVNLALAVFNMLPGLPLDGGNVVKSLIWALTGNQYKGVRFASGLGMAVAALMIAAGLLYIGGFNGIWFAVVGWFIFSNAQKYGKYAKFQERLSGLTAEQAAVSTELTVTAETSLRSFADFYVLVSPQETFLVTDFVGRLVGRIDRRSLTRFAPADWTSMTVSAAMESIRAEEILSPHQPLTEVIERLQQQRLLRMPVLQSDGRLVGQVRLEDIQRQFLGKGWKFA